MYKERKKHVNLHPSGRWAEMEGLWNYKYKNEFLLPPYPNILWSWGAPKRPWFQLSGCFHWEGEILSPNSWFTALAMSAASSRLSPSKTNCKIQATAIDDGSRSEDKIRRVSPPPGTSGIDFWFKFPSDVESGNSYMGSWVTPASLLDDDKSKPEGTIW